MDFLKRSLAPLIDDAWSEIEQEAVRVLKANLSARRIVDFEGPKGFSCSAVNLGTLDPADQESDNGVRYGIRKVLPLVEVRIPFQLDVWSLDNLARGAENVDLDPLVQAALKLAQFEEQAIYHGFAAAGVQGLDQTNAHSPIALGRTAGEFPDAVARAMMVLKEDGVGGPFALVLGPDAFRALAADVSTYPPRQRINKMLEGPVLYSPVLKGGFLVSMRGGDFKLTIGQDASIGYDHHDSKAVSLYLTETFTFQVLGPEAVVELKPSE